MNKRKSQEPSSTLTFEQYLPVLTELNLLGYPRVQSFLRELQTGRVSKSEISEINELIEEESRKRLTSGLLVAPPSEKELAAGDMLVAETVDPNGPKLVRIPFLPTPVVILGSLGVGKTTLVLLLIALCQAFVPVIAFDLRDDATSLGRYFQGQCLVIDAEKLPINFFNPDPGVSFESNARNIIRTLADLLTLHHRGQNVLQDAIMALHELGIIPTLKRIIQFLQENPDRYKINRSAYDSVLERLIGLDQIFGDAWDHEQGLTTEDLCKFRIVVIRTQSLGRLDVRLTYAALLQMRLYLYLRSLCERTNQVKILLVHDEADAILAKKSGAAFFGVFKELNVLGRGVGLKNIEVAHNATDIDTSFLNDAGDVFVFRLGEGKACFDMARGLGLPPEGAIHIGMLPNQYCYVRLNSEACRRVFLAKILPTPIDDTPLSPVELEGNRRYYAFDLEFPLAGGIPNPKEKPAVIEVSTTEEVTTPEVQYFDLSPEERYFLYTIHKHGFKGVTQVYDLASLSPTTGKKYIDRFIESGLVGTHTIVPPGQGGQPVTTFLTEKGRSWLQVPALKGIGGAEHQAYQQEFAYALRELGFKAYIERSVKGKSADIVVAKRISDQEVYYVAVEIECTTNVISNLTTDLSKNSGFAQVALIICGDTSNRCMDESLAKVSKGDRARVLVTTPKTFLREFVKWMEVTV